MRSPDGTGSSGKDDRIMVYNLDVAENRDFFVGKKGLLVHDFSFVRTVPAPFDQQPELESVGSN